MTFSTSLFARAMACEGSEHDSDPLGSGRPSFGLKYLLIDIDKTDNRQETPNHALFSDRKYFNVLNFRCRKNFVRLIFGYLEASENILTPKFSQFTVVEMYSTRQKKCP